MTLKMSEDSFSQMSTTCCNCTSEFKDEKSLTTCIDVKGKCKEINVIQVWDAIAFVYGTSWPEFKNYLQTKSDLLYFSNITTESFAICKSCTFLLLKNYKAHKQFEYSTSPLSIVDSVKNSCQRKISLSSSFECDFSNESETEKDGLEDVKPLISSPQDELKKEVVEFYEDCDGENEIHDDETTFEGVKVEIEMENEILCTLKKKVSTEQQNSIVERSAEQADIHSIKTTNVSTNSKRSGRSKSKRSIGKASTRLKNRLSSKKAFKFKKKISKAKKSPLAKIRRENIAEKKDGKFQCDICEKLCPTLKYLQNTHMPIHIEEKSCHICSKKLSSARSLRIHVKFVHKKAKRDELKVPCQVCGKLYTGGYLNQHMKMHGERVEFKCDDCGRVYLSKTTLEEHAWIHSDRFVPLKCQHCEKTFRYRGTLEAHERLHTAEKNFACDKCPARFHLKALLKSHEIVHTEERPFSCSECEKTFKSQQILKVHLKLHKELKEKGEYSSKCEECGSVFKNSKGLQDHRRRTHTRKITYQCSFCGKKLSKRDSLANHEQLHRTNPDYQPRKVQEWTRPPISRARAAILQSVLK